PRAAGTASAGQPSARRGPPAMLHLTGATCCFSTRRSLAAERRYGGHQPRNCAMQAFAATAVALRGQRRSRLGRPVRVHPSSRAEPVTAGRYTHVSAAPAAEAAEQAEEAEQKACAAGRGWEPVNVSGSQTLISCLVSLTAGTPKMDHRGPLGLLPGLTQGG